jgi:uncharacterized protein (UPF0262 family)
LPETSRISQLTLDERSIIRRSPQIEHERRVAIYDLVEANTFELIGGPPGPYHVHLGVEEGRLVFDVRDEADAPLCDVHVSLTDLRTIVRDYFLVCESYVNAIKTATASRIEAIDMGRRGLHNEGAEKLHDLLQERVRIDEDTARRLFTLICILHIRGRP